MARQPAASSGDRPRLRLVRGAECDPEDRRDWTLPEFYERFVLPVCHEGKDRQPQTVRAYRGSLKLWAQITGNPPLRQIDDVTCADFAKAVSQRAGLKGAAKVSPNTVIKHCTQLQFCLDKAGPRSRGNRLGQNILPEPPYLVRPKGRHRLRDRFTLDEITAWLDVLPTTATLPRSMRGIEPPRWWRGLIRFVYNSALRIDSAIEARREWIEVRAKRGQPPEHWLCLPAEATKPRQPLQVYLNQSARLAIEMVPRSEDGRIFAFPGWPSSQSWLQELRRRQLAEIPTTILPEDRRLGFHGLRRATLHWLAERNPLVARKVAGHSGGDVLADHYVGADVVIPLLERLPQPGPARQGMLF